MALIGLDFIQSMDDLCRNVSLTTFSKAKEIGKLSHLFLSIFAKWMEP